MAIPIPVDHHHQIRMKFKLHPFVVFALEMELQQGGAANDEQWMEGGKQK